MSTSANNPYGSPTTAAAPESYRTGQTRALQLQRVEPLSCGKMLAALNVLVGVIVAVIMLLMSLVAIVGDGESVVVGLMTGLIGAIFVPVLYGVMGFVGGVVLALLYNLSATLIGGIELQFQE